MGGQNAKAYNARLGKSDVAGQQAVGESTRRKILENYIRFANGVGEVAINLQGKGDNVDIDGVKAAVSYNGVEYDEDLRLDLMDEMMSADVEQYENYLDGIKGPAINKNTALFVCSYLDDHMDWEPKHEDFVKMMFSNSDKFSEAKNKAGYYNQQIKNAFSSLKVEFTDVKGDLDKFLKKAEEVLSWPKTEQAYITAVAFNCLLGIGTYVTYKEDFKIFRRLTVDNFKEPVSIEWQAGSIAKPTSLDTRYRDYPPYYADTSDNNEFLTKVRCGVIWDNISRYVRAVFGNKAGGSECTCSADCKCMEQTGRCECVNCQCGMVKVAGCGPCQDKMFGGAEQGIDLTIGLLILACILLVSVLFDFITDNTLAYVAVLLALGASGFIVLDKMLK